VPKPAKSLRGLLEDPREKPIVKILPMTAPEEAPWTYGAFQGTLGLRDQASTVALQLLPEGQCLRTLAVVVVAVAGDSPEGVARQ